MNSWPCHFYNLKNKLYGIPFSNSTVLLISLPGHGTNSVADTHWSDFWWAGSPPGVTSSHA